MIKLHLDFQSPSAIPPGKPAPAVFTGTIMSGGYLPGRGLLCSVLIHQFILFGLFFLPTIRSFTETPRPPDLATMIKRREVVYLPMLRSSGQTISVPRRGLAASPKGPSEAAEPRPKGLSYPGPQPILSDFPKPTNRLMTVLQPELQNPPVLEPPLVLPNLVQIAAAPVVPPLKSPDPAIRPPAAVTPVQPRPEVRIVAPELPVVNLIPPPPVQAPKLVLPVSTPLPEIKAPEPLQPKPDPAAPAIRGTELRNLLQLTPLPAPPEQPVKVPAGEARGQFAISPTPNLAPSETAPGSKLGTTASGVGIENRTAGAPLRNSAAGTGASAGPANGKDSSNGTGADGVRGSGVGSTPGTGNGPAKSPFSGITIVGGALEPGTAKNAASPTVTTLPPAPSPTSYGVTIVSTEASGGGLPQFGVFADQPVYTVYVDMKQTATDRPRSWTFEYGLLQQTPALSTAARSPGRSQEGLVLPFPSIKVQPVLPAELVRKYLRRLVIVYGIINVEGKMEQISVKQTPDVLLNEPVLNALSKWVFRPARLEGQTVPVKVLLGIPLLPE